MIQRLANAPAYPYQQLDREVVADVEDAIGCDQPIQLRIRPLGKTRRTIVFSCLAFVIGTLLIVFNAPFRNHLIVPGPLANHHAQILAGQGGNRCAACHGAANRPFLDWVRSAVQWGNRCLPTQSELCLNCHRQTLSAETALYPHGIEPSRLTQLTGARATKYQLTSHAVDSTSDPTQLACATCHREHHGAKFDLTALTDSQCQTCHLQRFQSFESDHPEFEMDLSAKNSTIAFDHVVHGQRYFVEKGREFECQMCHLPDSTKNVLRLASFETSCSECHADLIRESGQKGLVLFALPTLDVRAMSAAGFEIGDWPELATGDFDGRISPLMWVLLRSMPDSPTSLDRVRPGFDFADLNSDVAADLQIAAELALAIKRALARLAESGTAQLSATLELDKEQLSGLIILGPIADQLTPQFFRDALERWFPISAAEIETRHVSQAQPMRWLPLESSFAKWSVSQEPLADNPLVDTTAKPNAVEPDSAAPPTQQERSTNNATDAPPAGRVPSGEPLIVESPLVDTHNRPITAENSKPPALRSKSQPVDKEAIPASTDSELLAKNPIAGSQSPDTSPNVPPNFETDSGRGSDSIGNLELQRNQNALLNPIVNQSTAPAIEPDSLTSPAAPLIPFSATLQLKRGWLRDDSTLKISYHATGHADPTLTALQRLADSSRNRALDDFASAIELACSSSESALNCRSCHNSRTPGEQSGEFVWAAVFRDPAEKRFTLFNHAPHLLQLKCTQCHQFADSEGASFRFAGWASLNQTPPPAAKSSRDFIPISKAACASCHRRDQASNSCTTCHNYHVQ